MKRLTLAANISLEIKNARIMAGKLLLEVLLGKMSVLCALKSFPKNSSDSSVCTCFHILVHYDSDEDLRKKDPLYKQTQEDFIVDAAEVLLRGEPLPVNVINEYKDFYNTDLIYRPNTKENIINRLKRIINL